jgi:hypothetical protein
MKWPILFSVKLYWRLTNPKLRRPCLFRETCSRHVYRVTHEGGALKGLIAFVKRFRQCRLGYVIEFDGRFEPFLRLSDRSVARTVELSESMGALVEQARLAVSGTCLKQSTGSH